MTDEILSQSERIRLSKKESDRKYRHANKEKIAAYHKEYNQLNKEKITTKKKRYRQVNKEKFSAKGKAYYRANKESFDFKMKEFRRSKAGLVAKILFSQRRSSKRRNHPMPDYSREELQAWLFGRPNFDELYQNWVNSGFDKIETPSCDRINDYKPYTLDNIQLTTWAVNNARAYSDRKNGINNKVSKAVMQLTREGIVIAEHHSAMQAARVSGIRQSGISLCCRGDRPTAGGFVWCFANG